MARAPATDPLPIISSAIMRILIAWDVKEDVDPLLAALSLLAVDSITWAGVLYLLPPDPDFVGFSAPTVAERADLESEGAAAERRLEDLTEAVSSALGLAATPILRRDATGAGILDSAEAEAPDLVVLGSHQRHGWTKLLHGTVSQSVVTRSLVPVLVIPHEGAP